MHVHSSTICHPGITHMRKVPQAGSPCFYKQQKAEKDLKLMLLSFSIVALTCML